MILCQHPDVREAIVIASDDTDGQKRLLGYVMPHMGRNPTVEVLRSFLMEKVPDYMIPETFMILEAFPLTLSGKIDRRALPKLGKVRPDREHIFVPPSDPVERKLCDIWRQILNVDRVGIYDKFFSKELHCFI